ncbi:MAG: hypothetical protein IPJ74_16580 [Saprospiraceae bacterium]|nr:hypothetical protein [Saprospiraceae bacterium]
MESLRNHWFALFPADHFNQELTTHLFDGIIKNYNSRRRHYHNLHHITSMLELSNVNTPHLQQKDVVDIAIFYHDIIYNPLRKDNEERSARRASEELKELNLPKEKIDLVYNFILATKSHDLQGFDETSDLAYFLDFDLAILGATWKDYWNYAQQIRKEYEAYPDFLYNPGRVKVLQTFLSKPFIFYTATFRRMLEIQARKNIEQELAYLH